MKSRQQNVSKDRQTILRRYSTNTNENSEQIPIDLIIEIFLRLHVKSVARCRCVSKLWASILRRPYFTDLYLTRSCARPQLLFACQRYNELSFFSTPQSQNLDNESSSSSSANSIAASYHMRFPLDSRFDIISPINGLVFIRDKQVLKGRRTPELVSVICNPSTGQSFTLPKPNTRKRIHITSYFGYDPIEKTFKVLSMTHSDDGISKEHQVLTFGTERLKWRMIECSIPHKPTCDVVCINGALYYLAKDNMENYIVICFDVRSEKFSFIKPFTTVKYYAAVLINYNGKLGSLMSEGSFYASGRGGRFDNYISGSSRSLEMWVLEDSEKHEWSKHCYELPPLWTNLLEKNNLIFVGVIGTNEIVLSPRFPSHPFYIFYYNFERKTIRRVEIQGAFKEFRMNYDCQVYIFLDHVEDVKLM